MATTQHQLKIDESMDAASRALVARRYFEAERLAASALRKAAAIHDYDRIARIVLPLQEARRQRRDLAFDAGATFLVHQEPPTGDAILPGCYLIMPPRVGADGRFLRESAAHAEVPTIIVVREPTTRDGLWPIVAVGAVTVRAKLTPPLIGLPPAPEKTGTAKARQSKEPRIGKVIEQPGAEKDHAGLMPTLPGPEWFLLANELLGDAAIAGAEQSSSNPVTLVEALLVRLEAHSDHEKLHQRIYDAAKEAARMPKRPRRVINYGGPEFLDADTEELLTPPQVGRPFAPRGRGLGEN